MYQAPALAPPCKPLALPEAPAAPTRPLPVPLGAPRGTGWQQSCLGRSVSPPHFVLSSSQWCPLQAASATACLDPPHFISFLGSRTASRPEHPHTETPLGENPNQQVSGRARMRAKCLISGLEVSSSPHALPHQSLCSKALTSSCCFERGRD